MPDPDSQQLAAELAALIERFGARAVLAAVIRLAEDVRPDAVVENG